MKEACECLNESVAKVIEGARSAIEELMGRKVKVIVVEDGGNEVERLLNMIVGIIAEYFDLTVEELRSKKRDEYVVMARGVCMYIAFVKYGIPKYRIGKYFNRTHATVIHGINQLMDMMKSQDGIRFQVMDCVNLCKKANS